MSMRRSGCVAPSGAMTQGQVTGGWAWRHHRKWLRELVSRRPGAGQDIRAVERYDAFAPRGPSGS